MRVLVWFTSTLCVLFCNLYAEAIAPENVEYFQVSNLDAAVKVARVKPPKPPIVSPAEPTPPGGAKVVTPPPSSVQLLKSAGIWRDASDSVLTKQISDHALAGEMIDGDILIYTWNTWGFQSMGGFSAKNTETLPQYQAGRLKEQIGILYQIFNNSPEAIICLQEVNEEIAKARTAILNGLKALNVEAEYRTNTGPGRGKPGSQAFGQVILYRKDRYKPVRFFTPAAPDGYSTGAAGRFDYKLDPQQNGRVLKVYFEELTGQGRNLAVVNVHLASYPSADRATKVPELIKELINYAPGQKDPKSLTVITGDFNDTIGKYVHTDPTVTVTVKQVGKSVVWNDKTNASSTKQTADNVDGFIIVKP